MPCPAKSPILSGFFAAHKLNDSGDGRCYSHKKDVSPLKGTKDFYNKTAAQWAQKGCGSESELPCLMEFVRQFAPGSRFLDLCCGAGYEARRIHACGYEVVGIDFSEESIRLARENSPAVTFYTDDLLNDLFIYRESRCHYPYCGASPHRNG